MEDKKTSEAGEAAGAHARCGTNPPRRILVADDDIGIRDLNAQVLIHFGYEVDSAVDGAAAWQALNTDRYDLLITDHSMPELTGVELIKRLRAARMALPVIMATGTLPKEELTQNACLQSVTTLLKPYTVTELLGAVKEVLSSTEGSGEQIVPTPPSQNQP